MKISKIQKGLVLGTVAVAMFVAGCELIVDFDRTKIPVDNSEASVPDSAVAEASTPTNDGGEDADAGDAGDAADASETDDAADAGDAGDADAQ